MLDWAPLANEEPFVVVCGSLTEAKVVETCIWHDFPVACIKFYNSKSSNANCTDFDNANTAWANTDILIYTGQQFKRFFAYFHSQSVNYLVAHQM